MRLLLVLLALLILLAGSVAQVRFAGYKAVLFFRSIMANLDLSVNWWKEDGPRKRLKI
jgi:hypothetical protein